MSFEISKGKGIAAALFVSLVLFCQSTGWGYEEGPVVSPGTVTGKVVLKGTPPPPRIYHLIFSPNIDLCGRISDGKGNRLLRDFQVASDGGLKDVVVAIVGVEKGKLFSYTPEATIENCRIVPFVTPIRNNHPFTMINKDPIAHDVQGYTLKDDYTFAMFNKPLTPETIASKTIRLRKGHYIFRTQCGVHDYMQSWGIAIGNPYFAVTAADGSFTIPDLPPGEYDVIAWHPHMKVLAKPIRVEANGKVDLNFEFDSEEIKIPLHDLQMQYRLDTALQPHHLVPPIELQEY
ncbi:MAG: carboxypeptidase regulatory-like domain-containing protein [Candidatus Manganitrophaceae bacterium]|nr:MAG: carboxypeptidase regulatory-like domain-containing protein [Candidatus Manganitrophaceae bacterium]